MAGADVLPVEVVYARPDAQVIVRLELLAGATVGDAVDAAGLERRFPELAGQTFDVGVFGKVCARDTPLRAGDRVEIYRPLLADPKAVRKQRAAEGKRMRKGGGAEGAADV